MNYIKLNELAAQVMGFSIAPSGDARTRVEWPKSGKVTFKTGWNPCEDLNDASALLEKVCKPNGWEVMRMSHEWPDQTNAYTARGTKGKVGRDSEGRADTAALAMTLCALRVFGIPESSITEATNHD